ncbi:hypothetical protein Dimus_022772, partial [Dionaea muscipula]
MLRRLPCSTDRRHHHRATLALPHRLPLSPSHIPPPKPSRRPPPSPSRGPPSQASTSRKPPPLPSRRPSPSPESSTDGAREAAIALSLLQPSMPRFVVDCFRGGGVCIVGGDDGDDGRRGDDGRWRQQRRWRGASPSAMAAVLEVGGVKWRVREM